MKQSEFELQICFSFVHITELFSVHAVHSSVRFGIHLFRSSGCAAACNDVSLHPAALLSV